MTKKYIICSICIIEKLRWINGFFNDKKSVYITGHYGSGKTEFAVNYVTALREQTEGKVAIADLDIVNVYFRSREKKAELEEKGVMVIAL